MHPSMENNKSSISTNITSTELDPETEQKLRGDAIGNTMYSERFVLKTLLQFSDLKWSKDVEEDLCVLWDMTDEKDICKYLFENSFPALATAAIYQQEEPRFIEIVVGILANLLCAKCEQALEKDEILTIVQIIHSDDHLILIQVMRFIHALAPISDKMDFISELVIDKFVFILKNSTNVDLLKITMKTLAEITKDFKIGANVVKTEFLEAATVSYKQIYENNIEWENRDFELTTSFIEIVTNLCAYIDNLLSKHLFEELNREISPFLGEIIGLLNYYADPCNLFPISEHFTFYFEAISYIFRVVYIDYNPKIVKHLIKIISELIANDYDDLETFCEPLCYFLSLSECLNHKNDLKSERTVLTKLETSDFAYEFEYLSNVRCILYEE